MLLIVIYIALIKQATKRNNNLTYTKIEVAFINTVLQ